MLAYDPKGEAAVLYRDLAKEVLNGAKARQHAEGPLAELFRATEAAQRGSEDEAAGLRPSRAGARGRAARRSPVEHAPPVARRRSRRRRPSPSRRARRAEPRAGRSRRWLEPLPEPARAPASARRRRAPSPTSP